MKKYSHIHFIGIKGVAMTALAILAKGQGSKVTGSDIEEEFVTDEVLKRFGISWQVGFNEDNIIGNPDLVVVTGAHGGMTNKEAVAAKLKGLNVVMQGEALGLFMKNYIQISVVGCHGKTTTSALIATILEKAGLSPSFAIGCADIPILGTSAKNGKGKYFVAEADEYVTCPVTDKTPRFLWQEPHILVITNIEYDHPDVYSDIEKVKEAFSKIIAKVPANGKIIACIDDKNISQLVKDTPLVITYGQSPKANYQITNIRSSEQKNHFWLAYQGREIGDFKLSIPGEHNVYNATAAIIASLETGISLEKIRSILPLFTGTKRRFEKIGEINKILFYDDYAHHPTEIKATLKAAKVWFGGRRIIVVFQPHTYSRTKVLLKEFSHAFSFADLVIITGTYSSSRENNPKRDCSKLLVEEIAKFHPSCYYQKGTKEIIDFLKKKIIPGDIIFTMGAGDIYKIQEKFLNEFKN